MKSFLIWISCLLFFTLSLTAQNVDSLHNFLTFDNNGSARYNVSILAKKAEVTGIFALKDNGEQIVGSVFNEFGIKAFDIIFIKTKSKVKLMNVVGFLNKWYIRKVIKADMKYLFMLDKKEKDVDKNRLVHRLADGTTILKNLKYHLDYTFTPIRETQQKEKNDIAE